MTETGGQLPVSFPVKDVAVLLFITAPADAARHKRCLWSVSRVRPGTGRALLPLPAGVGDSVRQPVALF